MSLPTDPLFQDQWWLYNASQGVTNNRVEPGTPDIDLNVPLWPIYTGRGVKVELITNNCNQERSYII
ncbi:hypothetical protein ACL6C3_27630 [Capilliphycus salinus ALCB114379]|uniref:hypothetical protein n=1 Tax=Capilliphycus salinus TaxID=2768948 RepID=UPI0039A6AAB5